MAAVDPLRTAKDVWDLWEERKPKETRTSTPELRSFSYNVATSSNDDDYAAKIHVQCFASMPFVYDLSRTSWSAFACC